MPHITIEYSENVAHHHDIDALVKVVHQAALDHGLPPADGLRTRAAQRDHYCVADGSPDLAFIAIAVRIGPGRDEATKQSFITALLDAAEHHIGQESHTFATVGAIDAPRLAIAWSIELNEIDPDFRINRNHVRTRLAERANPQEATNG